MSDSQPLRATGLGALPAIPRQPRWRSAFRLRWPLGVLGLAGLIPTLAILTALQVLGVSVLPVSDDSLDEGHDLVRGRIESVEPVDLPLLAAGTVRVRYGFLPGSSDHGRMAGAVVVPAGGREYRPGAECMVEFLRAAPDVSRIRGTRRGPLAEWTTPLFGLVLLPSLLAVLWWVRGAVRLRLLLAQGRASLARIDKVDRLPFPMHDQLNVHYTADSGSSRQLVPASSPLGTSVLGGATSAPVVIGEGTDGRRLATAEDFAS